MEFISHTYRVGVLDLLITILFTIFIKLGEREFVMGSILKEAPVQTPNLYSLVSILYVKRFRSHGRGHK